MVTRKFTVNKLIGSKSIENDNLYCKSLINQIKLIYKFFIKSCDETKQPFEKNTKFYSKISLIFFIFLSISLISGFIFIIVITPKLKSTDDQSEKPGIYDCGDFNIIISANLVGIVILARLWFKRDKFKELIDEISADLDQNNFIKLEKSEKKPVKIRFRMICNSLRWGSNLVLIFLIVYSYSHLIHFSYILTKVVTSLTYQILITLILIIHSFIFLIIPIQIYVQINFFIVFIYQIEHLNVNLKSLANYNSSLTNYNSNLVLNDDQWTFIRLRFNQIANFTLKYDRIFHLSFSLIYLLLIVSIIINSYQVKSEGGIIINVDNWDNIVSSLEILLFCLVVSYLIKCTFLVNHIMTKPIKYLNELAFGFAPETHHQLLEYQVSY